MADGRPDPDPATASPADAIEPAEAEAESEATGEAGPGTLPGSRPDRRAFLRQLSGEALSTAGRLAGFSSIIRRSVTAAGDAVGIREPETPSAEARPTPPLRDPAVPVVTGAPSAPSAPFAPAPEQDPVAALTPDQHDFLARGARAVLAVNDPTGAPHLTSSRYHWDGSMFRLPAQLYTARAEAVDRDPRVGLLVEDAASEAWVAVTGRASVAYGDDVDREMLLLLAKYLAADPAALRWAELRASGDRIVIRIRPARFVWRPA